jgi:predicted dehydrogenase
MSIKSSIGVAFLGIGQMGETHLRNLLGLSEVRVVVVADPRLEAAERGKALAGAEQALTDVEQAITHPGVDAAVWRWPPKKADGRTALSRFRR